MRIRQHVLVIASTFGGCSTLTVSVSEYRGELAHSYRTRLAEARGLANEACELITKDNSIKGIFDELNNAAVQGRTPADFQKRINSIADEVGGFPTSVGTIYAGLPRPQEAPNDNETKENAAKRAEKNQEVFQKLNALEKELREFSAFLVELGNSDPPKESRTVVENLVRLGKEIEAKTEFPDFDKLNDPTLGTWVPINSVDTFGGLGSSEFVIVKDGTGNYQLKSAIFDPSDVAMAARKATTSVLKVVSSVYGIPLPGGSTTGDASLTSNADLDAATRDVQQRAELLQALDREFRSSLGQIGQSTADVKDRIDRLRRETDSYVTRLRALRPENAGGGH